MARKLTFTLALLVLVTVLTGASFANVIGPQITFGPNPPWISSGTVSIGPTAAVFTGVNGLATQGYSPTGTFNMSGGTLSYINNSSPYSFGPNSQVFSVTIPGTGTMSGYLNVKALFINAQYGFFAGVFDITSTTPAFAATGFSIGQATIDFVTYQGQLSSGQINSPSVPEPGTIALVGSGLLAAAGMLRRKR